MTRLTPLALLLLCLSLASKVRAEGDTNVQAQPNAIGNSSIINQNMNINNGMTGKQQFGNLICSQPTMAVTPFYTGNDAENTESETYSINEGWGIQMSFMIPLGSNNDRGGKTLLKQLSESDKKECIPEIKLYLSNAALTLQSFSLYF